MHWSKGPDDGTCCHVHCGVTAGVATCICIHLCGGGVWAADQKGENLLLLQACRRWGRDVGSIIEEVAECS